MHPTFVVPFDTAPPVRRTVRKRRPDAEGASPHGSSLPQLLAFALQAEKRLAEQARRIAELESMSLTDELTGLPNRRAFLQVLQRTLAAADRHGEHGSLVYIDLDGFKLINDRDGHDAGDAALRHMARALTGHVRSTDFVARLHGDEFAVVMVRAAVPDAAARMRELQRLLASTPLDWQGKPLRVGASFGVVAYDGSDADAAELMRRADGAMYEQKRRLRSGLGNAAE